MLRLEQLNYLCMVVRFGSVTRATGVLYVSPDAIGTSPHKLEKEVCGQLLKRQMIMYKENQY